MIFTSNQFNKALELELEQLVQERVSEYMETEAFYQRLDQQTQKELDQMCPFFGYESSGETLRLYLGPPESESKRIIDLESVLKEKFSENDPEHLQFILSRLEEMATAIREKL